MKSFFRTPVESILFFNSTVMLVRIFSAKSLAEFSFSFIIFCLIDNKTKLSMQFLADIMKNMSYKKLITKKDLYELSEKEVIEKIENCNYKDISKKFDFWKNACEIKESDKEVKGK